MGLAPGCGTQFFARTTGYQKACEYILTSKTFSAKKAKELGMVNIVVKSGQMDDTIKQFVEKFRKLPPLAVGNAKMLINKSFKNYMISHLELASKTASESAATEDF